MLRDLVQFEQFKTREKHLWRGATFSKQHFSMGVFHIFEIVQMVPNHAKHHKWDYENMEEGNSKSVHDNLRQFTEAIVWTCFSKQVFLKISQIFRKIPVVSLFLIKLQAWRPAALLKRDSNTGAFLWNLRNF